MAEGGLNLTAKAFNNISKVDLTQILNKRSGVSNKDRICMASFMRSDNRHKKSSAKKRWINEPELLKCMYVECKYGRRAGSEELLKW